ncbi:hypothetical protein N0V86_008453 [Didymella sp. IMI 355093]|nr:hypothetical protein N0V86_008453 [Didymella sp. IMI 355093]
MPPRTNKHIPSTLSQAKQNALRAIRASWKIANVSEMLSDRAITSFQQRPPNDDFFNQETLVLFQKLAELTEHKKKEVKTKLEVRWSARAHHRADGPHKAGDIKVGGTNKTKNENLRADLEEFIRDFEFELDTEKQIDHGKGEAGGALMSSGVVEPSNSRTAATTSSANKRERGSNDNPRPSKRETRSRAVKATSTGIEPEEAPGDGSHDEKSEGSEPANDGPDGDDKNKTERSPDNENDSDFEAVSRSSQTRTKKKDKLQMAPVQAIFIIKSAWRLPANSSLFDFLSDHSYDPIMQFVTDAFEGHRNLLRAIYELALATRDLGEDAQTALADAFADEDHFDKDVATLIIKRLARRFKKGKGRRLLLNEMDTLRNRNTALSVKLKQTIEAQMGQILDANAFVATFETAELKQAELELEQVKRERLVSFCQDQRLHEQQDARVWEKAIQVERQRFIAMDFMMELWKTDTAEVEDGAEKKTQEAA